MRQKCPRLGLVSTEIQATNISQIREIRLVCLVAPMELSHIPSLQGAQEIFSQLPHEFVSPDSLKDVVKNGGKLACC